MSCVGKLISSLCSRTGTIRRAGRRRLENIDALKFEHIGDAAVILLLQIWVVSDDDPSMRHVGGDRENLMMAGASRNPDALHPALRWARR